MGEWTDLRFPGEGHERYGHEISELIVKIV
jgi:hypothetical protein